MSLGVSAVRSTSATDRARSPIVQRYSRITVAVAQGCGSTGRPTGESLAEREDHSTLRRPHGAWSPAVQGFERPRARGAVFAG